MWISGKGNYPKAEISERGYSWTFIKGEKKNWKGYIVEGKVTHNRLLLVFFLKLLFTFYF